MFDSKPLGQPHQALRSAPADPGLRVRREAPQQSLATNNPQERSLALLRQLRGRWTELLGSQAATQLPAEAGAYMSRIAGSETLSGRELRLLSQMNAGRARPSVDEEGKPVLHDPKAALKQLDKQIRSLSARVSTQEGQGAGQVTRLQLQVFGTNQPMKSGSYQGVQTEPHLQRDTEARSEVHAARPEAKTSRGSEAEGQLHPVNQNRSTLRWSAGARAGRLPQPDRPPRRPPEPAPEAAPAAPTPVAAPTLAAAPARSLESAPPRAEKLPEPASEEPQPPVASKAPAPLTSVKVNPQSDSPQNRSKYPEWLQVKLSEDATPAYMTSLPRAQRSPQPFESKPLSPPPPPPALADETGRGDFRRSEEARTGSQPALTPTARPLSSAASGQLYQAALSSGMAPAPKAVAEPKPARAQDSAKKGETREESEAAERPAPPPPAARVQSQSPLEQTRGLQAALSGSAGKRETEDTSRSNLAAGWGNDPGASEPSLKNGRIATAQIPVFSPILDDLAERQQSQGKVGDSTDQSGRRGGGGGGGQQERQQGGQGGEGQQRSNEQQLQNARRLQADQRIELKTLEAYRLARTDEALRTGMRLQQGPQGQQLSELASRHAGHTMESLLKKTYRLDALGELSEEEAVNALGLVLKLGGEFTFSHSARVLELAMDLADEVGIQDEKTRRQVELGAMFKDTGEMALLLDQAPPEKIQQIGDFLSSQDLRKAGLLHDIGKIKIPPEILYKPGKLTEEEYQIMKMHPVLGEQMVYPIQALRHLCPAIRGHHERWDGKGYPDGLAGEAIPLPARIIAVADVFDALAAERPYKAGMPVERVQAILKEGRGTHFDPDLLDAFERVLQRRFPELSNPFA